jgi:hypothetical protein
MNERDRLEQLRALRARLEQMPESAQRDWMLGEVRARAVDVETGAEPAAMRALSEDGAEPEATRVEAAQALPPSKPKPKRRPPARRPAARAAWSAPRARPASPATYSSLGAARRLAAHASAVDLLQEDGVLCLDDQPTVADGASRPWSGGLRG